MDARNVDDAMVGVLVKRHPSAVYRWRKQGIDFVVWVGLLSLLGFPANWKPGDPIPKLPDGWKPGDPIPSTKE